MELSSLGVFSIDATSGVIRTNRTLDRETIAKYDLKVIAFDRGSPSLSSSVIVHITIEDCKYQFFLTSEINLINKMLCVHCVIKFHCR